MGILRITIAADLVIILYILALYQKGVVELTAFFVVCGPMALVTYFVFSTYTFHEMGRAIAIGIEESKREKEKRDKLTIPVPIQSEEDAIDRSKETDSPWWNR
tara:strand:- start:547 stop:855 length:309 start_codon:yes stop_codon:yes gene_type:complete